MNARTTQVERRKDRSGNGYRRNRSQHVQNGTPEQQTRWEGRFVRKENAMPGRGQTGHALIIGGYEALPVEEWNEWECAEQGRKKPKQDGDGQPVRGPGFLFWLIGKKQDDRADWTGKSGPQAVRKHIGCFTQRKRNDAAQQQEPGNPNSQN